MTRAGGNGQRCWSKCINFHVKANSEDLRYSRVAVVNNMYLKFAERVDLKYSHYTHVTGEAMVS